MEENKKCITCKHYDFYGCKYKSRCNNYYYEKLDTKDNESIKPNYYSNSDIDVIDFCNLNNIEFWCGNVIKYCVRSGKKSKEKEIEDLNKAIEYINRRIDYINKNN